MRRALGVLALLALSGAPLEAGGWLRAGVNAAGPEWGIEGGVHWALHPASGFGQGTGGPRGLIRIAAPCLPRGGYKVVNWLAVEPRVAGGPRGFSELERSADGKPGKRMWAAPSRLTTPAPGVEELAVDVHVERFRNGAEVTLTLAERSDRPEEIQVTVHAAPGSAPLEDCVVTATCGNKTRARRLWLRDGVESSLALWPDHRGAAFAPDRFFGGARFLAQPDGSALAALAGDEADPHAAHPRNPAWYYGGRPIVQYWRVPAGTPPGAVRVRVNGRAVYWASRDPVPGGVAFENFELRRPWRDGQSCAFGVTTQSPRALGFAGGPR